MAVVDIHAHIYPEKIAARAVEAVGGFYSVPIAGDGTTTGLMELASGAPITHFVVHSVATKPSNVTSINDFIAAQCAANPRLIGFMTLHHDMADPEAEITRARAMGLAGIKLHPDMQRVNMDDPRLMHIFELAEDLGLPVIVHCGDYRTDYSHPRRTRHIVNSFPNLRLNAAHMGGWSVPDIALEYLEDASCFLDMSSSLAFIGHRRMQELIRAYGSDRILFGSDFPMWSPSSEYHEFIETLTEGDFDQDEIESMTWHNAERFLGRAIA